MNVLYACATVPATLVKWMIMSDSNNDSKIDAQDLDNWGV